MCSTYAEIRKSVAICLSFNNFTSVKKYSMPIFLLALSPQNYYIQNKIMYTLHIFVTGAVSQREKD